MIRIKPSSKKNSINTGVKEVIKIPLGYYVEFNPLTSEIIVKNLHTNTIQCVHAGGKTVFKLQKKYVDILIEKISKKEFHKF